MQQKRIAMKVQQYRSVGLATVAFSAAIFSGQFVGSSGECIDNGLADGWCDPANNNELCGG